MTQEEFNAMLAAGIAQGLPGSYYTSKFANGEEIDRLLSSGGLPSGGAAGMVLGKRSASDYDTAWMSPAQARYRLQTTPGRTMLSIEVSIWVIPTRQRSRRRSLRGCSRTCISATTGQSMV